MILVATFRHLSGYSSCTTTKDSCLFFGAGYNGLHLWTAMLAKERRAVDPHRAYALALFRATLL